MKSWQRITTILLHSWYHTLHSRETWVDLLLVPFVQFLVFGFMSRFFAGEGSAGTTSAFQNYFLMGFLCWEVVHIGQYTITVSIMWEVWSKSLSTLFVSPLRMSEMVAGYAISGVIKVITVVFLLSLLAWTMFDYSLLTLGPMLLISGTLLFIFSIGLGVFIAGLVFRFGTDIQSMAWGLVYLLQPISAIFYPIDALPAAVRWMSYLSPVTFIMETNRTYLTTHRIDPLLLGISVVTTAVFCVLAVLFFNVMQRWSRQSGAFARLGM